MTALREAIARRTLPRWVAGDPRWRVAWWVANLVAIAVVIGFWYLLQDRPFRGDAWAYYSSELGPELYAGRWNVDQAYVYSPPARQLFEPFTWIAYDRFYAIWTGLLLIALVWLVGPVPAAALLAFHPFRHAVFGGNVTLFLAVALVLRGPAWAAFPLTKVTPSVILAWYAFRREWRPLAATLGTLLAISAVSFAIAPELWFDWAGRLVASTESPSLGTRLVPLPIGVRVAAAGLVTVFAARTDRPWLLAVAAWMSLPNTDWASLGLLTAIPRLAGWRGARGDRGGPGDLGGRDSAVSEPRA